MPDPTTPLLDIQQAIYARLTGDATLMGLVTGVFDHVPEDVDHPYVTIAESIESPDNRHGGFGRSTLITPQVWTRSRGHAQGLEIAGHIIRLLDHQSLSIAGHHTVSVRYELAQPLIDPEPPGDIRRVRLNFRITSEQP